MSKMLLLPVVALLVAILPATGPALADTDTPATAQSADAKAAAAVDPEKLAAIKKLLDTMRTIQNAHMGMDMMMEQQLKNMNTGIAARIDQSTDMSAEQKAQAKAKTTARLDRLIKRYRELVEEKINVPEIAEKAYVQLYDKYYTLPEINQMLVYYQSPVGQKTLDTMPQIVNEGVEIMSSQVLPKLKEVNIQLDEELRAGKLD